MIIKRYENHDAWLADRQGKITGTKLKDLITKRGTGKKIGFYQLIADRLALPPDGEDRMERGKRLELEAMERFQSETGKQVDSSLIICTREDNENIAFSPDGMIGETEAVEVKCLASARHIEALITNKVPTDYQDQVLQPFIVNDKLEKLYLVFYDPRLLSKKFFYLTIERDQELVDQYLELERKTLSEIETIVNNLMEF